MASCYCPSCTQLSLPSGPTKPCYSQQRGNGRTFSHMVNFSWDILLHKNFCTVLRARYTAWKNFKNKNQNLKRKIPFFFILPKPTLIQRSSPRIILCNRWENSLAEHHYTLQQWIVEDNMALIHFISHAEEFILTCNGWCYNKPLP